MGVMIEAPQNEEVASHLAPYHHSSVLIEDKEHPSLASGSTLDLLPTSAPITDTHHAAPEERYFLEGPKSRRSEFLMTLHIVRDFLRGFRVLHFVGPCDSFRVCSFQGQSSFL